VSNILISKTIKFSRLGIILVDIVTLLVRLRQVVSACQLVLTNI